METRLLFQDASACETPMLVVFAVDLNTGKSERGQPTLLVSSQPITAAAQQLLDSGEFKACLGETAILHGPFGLKAARLLLVGLGKSSDITLDGLRKAAG
ncbi:MAG TPA: M17 family peptidase N-terminal domain-containing protein, partial [Acidobacteriaceae bacterium]|nr:M17 family peptidase N-terminal domain-containing protein [Acidobacteriaceae bacterium]